MSRENLTKAWREEAELHGLIGAPHSGQAPTPPKPAGTPLPEKLERFSSGEETLAKIRELHSDIWLGHDGTPICEACDHKAPCETLRIIEGGDK